jgi:hypothetical protein
VNFAGVKAITIPEGDVKSVAIGGVTVWQKPNPLPYDAEVEYVESTGTQYIDTGFASKDLSKIKARFVVSGRPSSTYQFAGHVGTNDNKRFLCVAYSSSVTANIAYVEFSGASDRIFYPTTTVEFDHGVNVPSGSDNTKIFLFRARAAGGNNPTNTTTGKIRLYYFTGLSGSTTAFDFTPVRVGTAGYLYDRANPTGGPLGNGLYGSATGTPLVAGPDANGGAP